MKQLTTLSKGLVRIERIASRTLILGFVSLIIVNVALRYGVSKPIIYAEELAAILLVWLSFVAISISIHERAQVSVTIVTDLLSPRMQFIVSKCTIFVVGAMLAALLWASINWIQSPAVEFEQVITTGWSKAPFFVIMPIFCATSLVHLFAILFSTDAEE